MNPTPPSHPGHEAKSSLSYSYRPGKLAALRTKAEVRNTFFLIEAYVVAVPQKAANSILKALDEAIPRQGDANLQHLRRFAKTNQLPSNLKRQFDVPPESSTVSESTAVPLIRKDELQSSTEVAEAPGLASASPTPPPLHLLISATTAAPLSTILPLLHSSLPSSPRIHTIPVPAYPPTSQAEAAQWSESYWPTVYRAHNPHGPHPSILARAEEALTPVAGKWIALARAVAEKVKRERLGEGVGAVIVDPAEGESVIAAAGDARWKPILRDQDPDERGTGKGNVCAHAVLRAIGMVARKRRAVNSSLPASTVDANATEDIFLDYPLTETEKLVYNERNVKEGGYLCTGLDIWLTHEPCVMCAMAILHSRFKRVVFGRRMPGTGALTAEDEKGLGYGLFWLPELNWRMLGWEWVDDDDDDDDEVDHIGNIHA